VTVSVPRSTPAAGPREARTAPTCPNTGEEARTVVDGSVPALDGPPPLGWSRYRQTGEELGRGGQGAVFRAYDPVMTRDVAIKTLWISPGPDGVPEAEASIAAGRLQHPNILAVHDAFYGPPLHDGRVPLHLVMPYVAGRTLRDLVSRPDPADPPLDLRRRVKLLIQVGEAIRHAHQKGLAHRDVKSDNILVSESGDALLIDWGIAAPAARGFGWAFSPRWGGGTLLVMAPEVLDGKVLASFQADVYGVGVLLYEVLEGRRPFGEGPLSEHLARQARPPEAAEVHPPGLAALARRCMDPDPDQRPPDMTEVILRLRGWLEAQAGACRAAQHLREALEADARRRAQLELAAAHRAEAVRLRAPIGPRTPDADRAPAWRAEGEAREAELLAAEADAEVDALLRLALQADPRLPGARRLSADRLADQLRRASAAGEPAAVQRRLERALAEVDDARQHAALVSGLGAISLEVAAGECWVEIRRVVPEGPRLVPGERVFEGPAPLRELPVPAGSLICTLTAPGHHPVTLPLYLVRGEHLIHGPDGAPRPVRLPRLGELGPDEVYVPAGWTFLGGDPLAVGERVLPAMRVWVAADLAVRDACLTVADWMSLLNELSRAGLHGEAESLLPRTVGAGGRSGDPLMAWDATRGWGPIPDPEGTTWALNWPITQLAYGEVVRMVGHTRRRTGLPWRLLREDERARVARGADLRIFPWGDSMEPGWAGLQDCQPEHARVMFQVRSFPYDHSVFGPIFDLAGGMMEWHDHGASPELRVDGPFVVHAPPGPTIAVSGGHWASGPGRARVCHRSSAPSGSRSPLLGVRLCREL